MDREWDKRMDIANEKVEWTTSKTITYYVVLLLRNIAFVSLIVYAVNLAHKGYSAIKLFLFMGNDQAPIPQKLGFSNISEFSAFLDKISIILFTICAVIIIGAFLKDMSHYIDFIANLMPGNVTRRSIMRLRDSAGFFFLITIIGFYSTIGVVFYVASYYVASTSYAQGSGYISSFNLDSIIILALLFFVFLFMYLLLNLVVDKLFVPYLAQYVMKNNKDTVFNKWFTIKSRVATNTRQDERKHPTAPFTSEDTVKGKVRVKHYIYTIKPKMVVPYLFVEAPGVSRLSKYKQAVTVDEKVLTDTGTKSYDEKANNYDKIGEVIPKRSTKSFTDRPVLRPAKKNKVNSGAESDKDINLK